MNNTDWLSELKAGDKVIVDSAVHEVARLTTTQIVLTSGGRFRRSTGFMIGTASCFAVWLRPATEQAVEEIRTEARHRALSSRLAGISWRFLSLETLEAVYALLPKEE